MKLNQFGLVSLVILIFLGIWLHWTISYGNQEKLDIAKAQESIKHLETMVAALKQQQQPVSYQQTSTDISSSNNQMKHNIRNFVSEKTDKIKQQNVQMSKLVKSSQMKTINIDSFQHNKYKVKIDGPEKKGYIAKMKEFAINKLEDYSEFQTQPFMIIEPKSSEVVNLNDFPCPETEMHTCACQVKCKDEQCSRAIDLCYQYSSSSSNLKDKCGAIVISDGTIWATLKRTSTTLEQKLLTLRTLNYENSMKLIQELDASQFPSTTTTVRSIGSSSLNQVAEQIKSTLGPQAVSSSSSLFQSSSHLSTETVKAWTKGGYCSGGGLQNRQMNQHHSTTIDGWSCYLNKRISIVTVSMKSPASLASSMLSWQSSGLLDLVSERIAFLSEPMAAEVAISEYFQFKVYQPNMFENARKAAINRFTIGSVFYHSMHVASADFILFLEKDFAVDELLSQLDLEQELVASSWLLNQGATVVRLSSRSDMGCGGFRSCAKNKPEWNGKTTRARRRNWFNFYCETTGAPNNMADCIQPITAKQRPWYRCFSSYDSNWSLNAAFINRKAALQTLVTENGGNWTFGSLASYGESKYDDQAGFEVGLLIDDWGKLRVPICLSYHGIFKHKEVDL